MIMPKLNVAVVKCSSQGLIAREIARKIKSRVYGDRQTDSSLMTFLKVHLIMETLL